MRKLIINLIKFYAKQQSKQFKTTKYLHSSCHNCCRSFNCSGSIWGQLFLKSKTNGSVPISGAVDTNKKAENGNTKPAGGNDNSQIVSINVSENDHIRGNKNAPVTIIEFSDFQCPYCSNFHETMKQVVENYPNDVRWVYKHFPLDSIHPYARKAAEASECAADQDKFWEYTDELFKNQSNISPEYFSRVAKSVGLNTSQFDECLDSEKYKSKVNNDYQQGIQAGVRGTPGNFINGQSVPSALPYEQIKSMIDGLL